MKRSDTLEILMFTETSFSKRQFFEMNAQERSNNLTPAEELEAACWNGLPDEMLSEIIHHNSCIKKFFIWQVETTKSFAKISMGVFPPIVEMKFMLDPHVFLSKRELN
jgi:hypothetical protein